MPAERLAHDWFSLPLPTNIRLGERTWLYSSYAFSHYSSEAPVGLRVGSDTGLYHGTFFDLGPNAEVEIGDYCSLVGAIFATNGRVTIGNYTFIAHEVVIGDSDWAAPVNNRPNPSSRVAAQLSCNSIEIGSNVWIGAQAVVIGGVTIGESSIIGAGTVVTRDVPPYAVCAGNPMRVVRTISRRKDSAD